MECVLDSDNLDFFQLNLKAPVFVPRLLKIHDTSAFEKYKPKPSKLRFDAPVFVPYASSRCLTCGSCENLEMDQDNPQHFYCSKCWFEYENISEIVWGELKCHSIDEFVAEKYEEISKIYLEGNLCEDMRGNSLRNLYRSWKENC